jgi:hypothetical protein
LPAALPVQERVVGPPPLTLAGLVHDRLVELVATVNETVPENRIPVTGSGPTVMVEVPATPTVGETLVGVADRPKSSTVTVKVAEWVLPLVAPVPVTVTV